MDRRYPYAVFWIVLLACLQISACGGGGSTTKKLTVVTTALPTGTVGVGYSAVLEASGGTAPYSWSQVSGGAMAPGLNLSSLGYFTGVPSKSGTFGPYVFEVTDSASPVNTANSVSLSITVNGATGVSVTTTSLPNGVVGTAYSATLAATGGTSPYTWREATGGALPPGLSVSSTGTLSGTPTTPGSYGPYVFTVTDASNASANSGSLTITVTGTAAVVCTPLGNEAALTSANPYAFLLKGTDGSGKPIYIAGSFTPNGSGGITNASADYNGLTDGPQSLIVDLAASSYAFGSSAQGCLYLAFSGLASGNSVAVPINNITTSFYLSGNNGTTYTTGRIIESDNTNGKGTNASGFVRVQTPVAFALTALQANYAFGVDGWTVTAPATLRTAMAGTFTNASGTLSAGYADLNSGGTASGELTGGNGFLSASIDATTGRGTGSYSTSTPTGSLTFDFVFYVLNGSDLILLSTDQALSNSTTPLLAGRALASNASPVTATLNGYYLLASQGLQASGTTTGNTADIGTLNATSAGTIPTATIYSNLAGTYSVSHPSATYTVEAASGRVSTSGLLTNSPVVYLTAATSDDGIAGFLIGTDAQASSGWIVNQTTTAPSYTVASVTGNYAASTEEDADGKNGAFLGLFDFNGAGAYTLTAQSTGTVPVIPASGAIAINTDGSGNLNGGNFPLVTNGNLIFAIPDSGDPLLYELMVGTAAP